MAFPTDRDLITIEAAAVQAGKCGRTITRWIATGRLTAYRVHGNKIRVDRREVGQLVAPVLARSA